jgi:hypothetical protein
MRLEEKAELSLETIPEGKEKVELSLGTIPKGNVEAELRPVREI